MRREDPKSLSRRALRLALLCALVLQAFLPQAFLLPDARPAMAGPSQVTCVVGGAESDTSGSGHDSGHELCCTAVCTSCCALLAAFAATALVLPVRRPVRVGSIDDQAAASGAPLDLFFAARGPPSA